MLLDKGYYDYDYVESKPVVKVKTYDESVMNDEELKDVLGRFGWGKPKEKTAPTDEEIQAAGLDFLQSREQRTR